MSERPVVLATRSAGKLAELRPMFAAAGLAVIDLGEAGVQPSPVEDTLEMHATFEENALAKARYFHRCTRLPVAADDSGLEVAALGGAPGVHSKRWSGRDDLAGQALDDANNRLLVERLGGLDDRRARYVCAAAYTDGERELVCRGEVDGRILEAPRGKGGFGYDPYFWSIELERTFAEVERGEKQRVSHRGRAFAALLSAIATTG